MQQQVITYNYNMNGRMYDPLLSSFLSPDNYMQDPTSQQGFNRYAYCMYNPLKYVDPTGEQYFGWDPGMMNRIEQEAKRIVRQCWQVVYDDISMSHAMTVALANSIYSQGNNNMGNGGSGNHGGGGGGIQVRDLGNGRYEVVGGSVGPDHSITVIDGPNSGRVIGQYLTDFSFADKYGDIVIGAIIDIYDYSGQNFWDEFVNKTPSIDTYINDIMSGDNGTGESRYNFKAIGNNGDDNYHYRGMPINFGDGIYITTARDIGNFAAGYLCGINGLSYIPTRLAFDLYQFKQDHHFEPKVSRLAQDRGYFWGTQVFLTNVQINRYINY